MDETKDSTEMDQWYVAVNSSYAQASKRESQSNEYESLADVKKGQDELMKPLPSISVEEHISTECMKSDML